MASRDFSGFDLVIVAKSETVWNLLPADVGFLFFTAISKLPVSHAEDPDRVTPRKGHHGPFGIGPLTHH